MHNEAVLQVIILKARILVTSGAPIPILGIGFVPI